MGLYGILIKRLPGFLLSKCALLFVGFFNTSICCQACHFGSPRESRQEHHSRLSFGLKTQAANCCRIVSIVQPLPAPPMLLTAGMGHWRHPCESTSQVPSRIVASKPQTLLFLSLDDPLCIISNGLALVTHLKHVKSSAPVGSWKNSWLAVQMIW